MLLVRIIAPGPLRFVRNWRFVHHSCNMVFEPQVNLLVTEHVTGALPMLPHDAEQLCDWLELRGHATERLSYCEFANETRW
jgi:hypothetical protein